MYNIRHIRSFDEVPGLGETWTRLLAESPSDNYFLSWDWLRHWWTVYAKKDDSLAVMVVEDGDEIIGIAPFYVRKRFIGGIYPVRRMMFLGTQEEGEGDVCSDYLDIIYKTDEERAVLDMVFTAIVEKDICDEIYLSKIDASANTFELFQEKAEDLKFITMIANEFVSPYIQLPSTWDEYLNSLGSSMRYKIRNERRKLQKDNNVVFNRVESNEDLTKGFDELVRLHGKRWKTKGGEGAFSHPLFSEFHRGIMPGMLKSGQLNMTALSENGESKAVLYNILYKNKIYFYQSGIDTSDRRMAFGYLLHSHCIEEAIKNGRDEYDFLPKGGSDDYKDHFSKQRRVVSDIYMARQWMVKRLVRAEESARSAYHRIKPYLQRVK